MIRAAIKKERCAMKDLKLRSMKNLRISKASKKEI
ncbi:hypothetical protein BJV38_004329 [Clostridium beijerinckii]|nr:hypothetical protein [Clostridium beijerinckii]